MSTATRWYAQGLAFECTGCGRCCTGMHGYVWVSVEEARALAARLSMTLDDFGRRHLRRVGNRYALLDRDGGECVFLDGKRCGVYEDRPAQCRAFPWWPGNLASARTWKVTAQSCEGIRADAPLVSRAAIDGGLALARTAGLRTACDGSTACDSSDACDGSTACDSSDGSRAAGLRGDDDSRAGTEDSTARLRAGRDDEG